MNLVSSEQAITPLCQAAAELNQDTVQLLVKSGAQVNLPNPEDGNTPLFVVVLASRHTSHVATPELEDTGKLETACNIITFLGH